MPLYSLPKQTHPITTKTFSTQFAANVHLNNIHVQKFYTINQLLAKNIAHTPKHSAKNYLEYTNY